MDKKEKLRIEKLVSERGDFVKKAIDKWYEQIPRDKLDKPIVASLGIESKIMTPKDLHKELTERISKKSVSTEQMGLLKEIISKYGDENK